MAADGQPTGFDFSLSGTDPSNPTTPAQPAWAMSGSGGQDHLSAAFAPDEAALAGAPGGVGLDLRLAATKPAALHDDDGWIDFGPAGGSYYYSRTAMTATGMLTVDGQALSVDGSAWFDHQWGDFISVGGGGWDWFAVNLDDGTDLTLSLVRDADGTYPLIYGTVVARDGTVRHLRREDFAVQVTDRWTSPATGADYPAGWSITIPGEDLALDAAADGRRPGARHASDDRRRLLGGLAGGPGQPGRDAARWRGLRRADRLRRGAADASPRCRRRRSPWSSPAAPTPTR